MASKQKPAVEWKKRISQEYKRLLQVKRLKRTVAVKVAWSTNLKKLHGSCVSQFFVPFVRIFYGQDVSQIEQKWIRSLRIFS